MPAPLEIPVALGPRSYVVRIAPKGLTMIGCQLNEIKAGPKVALISDESVHSLYGEAVLASIRSSGREAYSITVPPGEASKDLARLGPLLSFLARSGLGRKDTVLALGGGVIGDLAGFLAASYLRGVPFVQAPTSLLAMVDSSVGGKTGVNLPEGKNLVGAFHQPRLVVIDTETLATLTPRERSAGMAEVIKYGLIADAPFFRSLRHGMPEDFGPIIRRSVEIKAEVVSKDEFETTGLRATLNFGHTLGHAIENAAGYGVFLHGEAISIGIRAAAHLSHKKLGLPLADVREIEATLAASGLPLHAPQVSDPLTRTKILSAMKLDKKAEGGVNRWILLPAIGQTVVTDHVSLDDVEALLSLIATPPGQF
ncbi:3-dehydroquinate synthase [Verrucomicrobium sp. GAS474]|uniref:3-dehydroquinate synthase n=1 Tax=Verrucomicrobium sp. GAS474 TaxID=1882831 RepID=UPI00087C68A4|nr:3-dehydroquinate synthase [Verrucomicrobium sp. GAS474]SDU21135.1 3-dehydroquinate synthase [Verrucomicrobium sp. GAS474]